MLGTGAMAVEKVGVLDGGEDDLEEGVEPAINIYVFAP
jgi:hypothetical protein